MVEKKGKSFTIFSCESPPDGLPPCKMGVNVLLARLHAYLLASFKRDRSQSEWQIIRKQDAAWDRGE